MKGIQPIVFAVAAQILLILPIMILVDRHNSYFEIAVAPGSKFTLGKLPLDGYEKLSASGDYNALRNKVPMNS